MRSRDLRFHDLQFIATVKTFCWQGEGLSCDSVSWQAYNRPPSNQHLISFDSIKKEIFNVWVEVIRFVNT